MPIDIAYRDYEVRDLVELERTEGVNLEPMRLLFRENRMVSSLAGDFDHKSCWEMLTDPQLTQKYFTAEERQVFRRHILWTRVLSDRETTLPDGDRGRPASRSSASITRCWCSSRIAPTAATAW